MNKTVDAYQMVTNRILEKLDKGIIPWHEPWGIIAYDDNSPRAYSYATGKPYTGINQIILDHKDCYVTFLECKKHGGRIKAGSHGEHIVYWQMNEIPDKDENGKVKTDKDGNAKTKKIPLLKMSTVFWIGDTEGLKPREMVKNLDHAEHDTDADNIITNYCNGSGVQFVTDEKKAAYYRPLFDDIHVPPINAYRKAKKAEYYSTAFHEMTHSTGASNRLDRFGHKGQFSYGSHAYSKEELIAEMGAAMLVNYTGLETEASLDNSAAYIKGWMAQIAKDPKLVVQAASKAQKAVEYILQYTE